MSNKANFLLRIFIASAFTFIFASFAQAQATRTWISGVGDDANPCSRTAPCRTFIGAFVKTAAGGEINAIDPGGAGAINTISKSITIDTTNTLGGVLAAGTNGVTINGDANTVVTLRGLDINGAGTGINGIRIINAKTVNIENCVIYNFSNFGISDERTGGGNLFVTNTIIRNNTQANVGITGTGTSPINAVLDKVQLKSSIASNGLTVQSGNSVIIRDSTISGNFSYGVLANSAMTELTVIDSLISNNQTGIGIRSGTATIRISNVTVTKNVNGLVPSGGQILSFLNNKITANTNDGAPTGPVNQQ